MEPDDLVRVVLSKAAEFPSSIVTKLNPRKKEIVMVKWVPPPSQWLKLNTDGSVKGNPGLAGAGVSCSRLE